MRQNRALHFPWFTWNAVAVRIFHFITSYESIIAHATKHNNIWGISSSMSVDETRDFCVDMLTRHGLEHGICWMVLLHHGYWWNWDGSGLIPTLTRGNLGQIDSGYLTWEDKLPINYIKYHQITLKYQSLGSLSMVGAPPWQDAWSWKGWTLESSQADNAIKFTLSQKSNASRFGFDECLMYTSNI